MDDIIKIVCDYYEISLDELNRVSRKTEIIKPRQVCHYFLRKFTILSYREIGNLVGKKNHATVMNSCLTVNNLKDTDKTFALEMIEIEDIIQLKNNIKKNNGLLIMDNRIWKIHDETEASYKITRVGKDDLRRWDEIPKNIVINKMVKFVID